jgi:hypothetical protein
MQTESGAVGITVVKEGFAPVTTSVNLSPGQEQALLVEFAAPTDG